MKSKIILGLIAMLVVIFVSTNFLAQKMVSIPEGSTQEELKLGLQNSIIESMLKRSCFDCHSNSTRYPWYFSIPGVNLLMARNISLGRSELNFSNWLSFSQAKQNHILKEAAEEVIEDEMPPRDYLLMHPEAKITKQELEALRSYMSISGHEKEHEGKSQGGSVKGNSKFYDDDDD